MQVGVDVQGHRVQGGLLRSAIHKRVACKPELAQEVGVIALCHPDWLKCLIASAHVQNTSPSPERMHPTMQLTRYRAWKIAYISDGHAHPF